MEIHVALVDGDAQWRQAVQARFRGARNSIRVQAFALGQTALEMIAQLKPQVVVLDLLLPDMRGIDCLRRLRIVAPDACVMVLSATAHENMIVEAFCSGADAYLVKPQPLDRLRSMLKAAADGNPPSASVAMRALIHRISGGGIRQVAVEARLSPREGEVMDGLARGCLYKEIAEELRIEVRTVHTLARRAFAKLGTRSRTQAVARFVGAPRGRPVATAAHDLACLCQLRREIRQARMHGREGRSILRGNDLESPAPRAVEF